MTFWARRRHGPPGKLSWGKRGTSSQKATPAPQLRITKIHIQSVFLATPIKSAYHTTGLLPLSRWEEGKEGGKGKLVSPLKFGGVRLSGISLEYLLLGHFEKRG
jgi:hypothetical protein